MKNEVIGLLTYLSYNLSRRNEPEILFKMKHKLNLKFALFGRYCTYYNSNMDFTSAIIIKDNRL